ncbi:disease resistance protein RPV1-like [Eucalyptus grandis]|uniref:disease resistance protein RPV1-like n=1 Tax=Eucalyptus grandis TaxID=71139 RepID=UPI00192EA324|nr:disease resistance protein RPV1-like [Eucalyptus grandis]
MLGSTSSETTKSSVWVKGSMHHLCEPLTNAVSTYPSSLEPTLRASGASELSQIVTNTLKSEGNKEILPIFYYVEPDDVKLETPLYCDALLNLKCEKKLRNEEEKKLRKEEVNAWREALTEIDPIKGWEVKEDTSEGELIKLVVETVIQKLKTKQKPVIQRFNGIDQRIPAISNLLDINSSGVRLIKIYGMGALATVIVILDHKQA